MSSSIVDNSSLVPPSVGSEEIDSQHCEMLHIVRDLGDSIKAGCPQVAIQQMLSKLLEHALIHFNTEEHLMRSTQYPYKVHHILEHRKLINDLTAIKNGLDRAHSPISPDLPVHLERWLITHIDEEDTDLVQFLRQRRS